MRSAFPGPLAILALGALALWWLYRRAPTLRTQAELATAPLRFREPGPVLVGASNLPIYIDPIRL